MIGELKPVVDGLAESGPVTLGVLLKAAVARLGQLHPDERELVIEILHSPVRGKSFSSQDLGKGMNTLKRRW